MPILFFLNFAGKNIKYPCILTFPRNIFVTNIFIWKHNQRRNDMINFEFSKNAKFYANLDMIFIFCLAHHRKILRQKSFFICFLKTYCTINIIVLILFDMCEISLKKYINIKGKKRNMSSVILKFLGKLKKVKTNHKYWYTYI